MTYPCFSQADADRARTPLIVDNILGTTIQKSSIHGFGLFTDRSIAAGAILCILDGQVVSWSSYNDMQARSPFTAFSPDLFMEWNALDTETLLIRPFRTKYSYINHSRSPNTILERFPLRLTAILNINSGDELTIDYRREPLSDDYLRSATYL